MFLIIAILLFSIPLLTTIDIAIRAKRYIKNPKLKKVAITSIIAINAAILMATLIGVLIFNQPGKSLNIIATSVILFLVIVTTQLLFSALSLVCDIASKIIGNQLKTVRWGIALISVVMLLTISFYQLRPNTNYNVEHIEVEIDSLPERFNNMRIVQVSDIHVGNLTESEKQGLNKMSEICNSLNPDVMVITGDIVSSRPDELENNTAFLSKLNAKIKKIFIFGNHDIGMYNRHLTESQVEQDISDLAKIMTDNGFDVLRDSVMFVGDKYQQIAFMGVSESPNNNYAARYIELYKTIPSGTPIISLSHNPGFFERVNNFHDINVPLTLAGHTHAMQIEVKAFGLDWSPSDSHSKFSRGMKEYKGNKIYINKGLGYHIYRRIGTRPEITLIELKTK